MKDASTHTGTVNDHNYGKPRRWTVPLRQTAKYWIAPSGDKYRKSDGQPAGATMWNQLRLDLTSVKELP